MCIMTHLSAFIALLGLFFPPDSFLVVLLSSAFPLMLLACYSSIPDSLPSLLSRELGGIVKP